MIDLRFPTALQMVLSLAVARETGSRCTSAELALGLGANPVLVRKLLTPLARDGIVMATLGKNGGVRLGRAPDAITLGEIYASVVEDKRLFATRPNVPDVCVVSRNIETFFTAVSDTIEKDALASLSRITVAQGLSEIRRMEGQG
ncbi:transcriptional regulator [Brevundimonas sp. LM2]|uniref:Rrf2 family transcriptional regulator n=1 Tax=Brevundimonas sp. LM2 TaxID=1938605 RepID=UPI000983C831|nr:Rrf2 family transcriptional regulator [Brevundimonas sp. LM2]AQR60909.1 transcriptional regulator [Brevundimonas sp. LM2]